MPKLSADVNSYNPSYATTQRLEPQVVVEKSYIRGVSGREQQEAVLDFVDGVLRKIKSWFTSR